MPRLLVALTCWLLASHTFVLTFLGIHPDLPYQLPSCELFSDSRVLPYSVYGFRRLSGPTIPVLYQLSVLTGFRLLSTPSIPPYWVPTFVDPIHTSLLGSDLCRTHPYLPPGFRLVSNPNSPSLPTHSCHLNLLPNSPLTSTAVSHRQHAYSPS